MEVDVAANCPHLNKYEINFANFIVDQLKKSRSSLSLIYFVEQLPLFDAEVRNIIGSSLSELRMFLNKCNKLFRVTSDDCIILAIENEKDKSVPFQSKCKEPKAVSDPDSELPEHLRYVQGIIVKVSFDFGFIFVSEPVKARVFFSVQHLTGISIKKMSECLDIFPGQKVYLNAQKQDNYEAKYRATKVWMPDDIEPEYGYKSKTGEEFRFHSLKDQKGKVCELYETYGFIIVDYDWTNQIYFDCSATKNFQKVSNLKTILKIEDEVEFSAIMSEDKNRWEAIKVWPMKNGKRVLNRKLETSVNVQNNLDVNVKHKKIWNQQGEVYTSRQNIVIKFGRAFSELAEADSCPFYAHGRKVKYPQWDFDDGDVIFFDAILNKSTSKYKAILAWSGDRPDVVIKPEIDGSDKPISDLDGEEVSSKKNFQGLASPTFENPKSYESATEEFENFKLKTPHANHSKSSVDELKDNYQGDHQSKVSLNTNDGNETLSSSFKKIDVS